MALRIYPAIGLARVGDSPDKFFIGSETPGRPDLEIDAAGVERPVSEYKDSELRIKRQASRFRIFDVPEDGGAAQPVDLSDGSEIEWTVHLVNRKGGVVRSQSPPDRPSLPEPIADPALTIDPGPRTISGASQRGQFFDTGSFMGRTVPLGELRTDGNQNLLVLGGAGFSSSPTNRLLPSFYENPGWHDDTSDGRVTARIRRPDGSFEDAILPAWVIAGPPDFAADILGIVTLYDIILQVGIDHFGVSVDRAPSFTREVFPILRRTSRLQWVNTNPNWTKMNTDWAALADNSVGAATVRAVAAKVARDSQTVLSSFSLTGRQLEILSKYEAGDLNSDWEGVPAPAANITPEGLSRAALESTVGQGFYPGIEAGIVLRNPDLYSTPFDFRIGLRVQPGDLTAQMARPWQADFFDCQRSWWPAQRPDDIRQSASSADRLNWARGIDGHMEMVQKFSKLGFVTPATDGAGNVVYVETQRAPESDFH